MEALPRRLESVISLDTVIRSAPSCPAKAGQPVITRVLRLLDRPLWIL